MSSKRKQIRQNIKDRLADSILEVEGRVFKSRPEALGDVELPCICIYTRNEPVDTVNSNPTVQSRKLLLAVEALVKGSGEIDDELDDLADAIEKELLESSKQYPASGLYQFVDLKDTQLGFYDLGRKPMGAARLTFEISYEKIFT